MTFKQSLLATLLMGAGLLAQATEFRSADIHNADDYPTVIAVKQIIGSNPVGIEIDPDTFEKAKNRINGYQ